MKRFRNQIAQMLNENYMYCSTGCATNASVEDGGGYCSCGMVNKCDEAADAILHAFLDVLNKYESKGSNTQVPCPDGVVGCLVYHTEFRMTPEDHCNNVLVGKLKEEVAK